MWYFVGRFNLKSNRALCINGCVKYSKKSLKEKKNIQKAFKGSANILLKIKNYDIENVPPSYILLTYDFSLKIVKRKYHILNISKHTIKNASILKVEAIGSINELDDAITGEGKQSYYSYTHFICGFGVSDIKNIDKRGIYECYNPENDMWFLQPLAKSSEKRVNRNTPRIFKLNDDECIDILEDCNSMRLIWSKNNITLNDTITLDDTIYGVFTVWGEYSEHIIYRSGTIKPPAEYKSWWNYSVRYAYDFNPKYLRLTHGLFLQWLRLTN